MVLSPQPLAKIAPSALKAILSTKPLCPGSVINSCPALTSHILIVSSLLPLAELLLMEQMQQHQSTLNVRV
jgi:hypothetical protein